MTKDDLFSVKTVIKQLSREVTRLSQLKDWCQRITAEIDGLPHNTTFARSAVENLTVQIVDCQNTIDSLRIELANRRAALVNMIDKEVTDNTQRAILIERYCFDNYFAVIAATLHLSESQVYYLHRHALRTMGIKDRAQNKS